MPEHLLKAADAVAGALMEEHRLPGLAVAVVQDGQPTFVECYGQADIAAARPFDSSTIVRVGSVTKTFTAVAVLQLVEQGLIGLDDAVARHLPGYRIGRLAGVRPFTVREVLSHTSGMGEVRTWRDFAARSIPFLVDEHARVPTHEEFFAGGLRPDTAPGRRNTYSNYAFTLLGPLVTAVTGVPFDEYVKERVLEPLGMTSSDMRLTAAVRAGLAQGYAPGDPPQPVPYQHIVIGPAGNLHASVDDMVRYLSWVSTTGETAEGVLKPETLQLAFERQWEPDTRLPGYGLGFARDDVGGHAIVGHDGGLPGFVTSMSWVPSRRFGVFAVTNTLSLGARALADRLLWTFLDVPPPAERVPVAGAERHDRPDVRSRLAGLYVLPRGYSSNARWWNEIGGEVHIADEGGHLVLRTRKGSYTGGVRLYPGDPADELFWIGPTIRMGAAPVMLRLRFRAGPDGRVNGFDGGLAASITMNKRPRVRSAEVYVPAAKATGAAAAVGIAASLLRRPRR